jgi:predicted kinase
MKIIIIGTSASGKSTVIKYLRENTKFQIKEIDEELTSRNNNVYPDDFELKHKILTPKIIDEVLNSSEIIFFSNTDYFQVEDLKKARLKGFQIYQLIVPIEELLIRNKLRKDQLGYDDLSEYFEGMLMYQKNISNLGLVDMVIDGRLSLSEIANKIINSC